MRYLCNIGLKCQVRYVGSGAGLLDKHEEVGNTIFKIKSEIKQRNVTVEGQELVSGLVYCRSRERVRI
jgi:hypothetical protein